MKWLCEARVFKQRAKRYEATFNWRCVWMFKRKGERDRKLVVDGLGYRREIHARYAMWRYLVGGYKRTYPTQMLIEETEKPYSVWPKPESQAAVQKHIDGLREPVLEPGDDGYDAELDGEDVEELSRRPMIVVVDPEPATDDVVLKILGQDDDDDLD